jgi:hypothetical protein
MLQVCKRHPGVDAAVFDLPLVCDIGLQHIQQHPEADRISFIKGNALTDALPQGYDLITFKSMLHDWPDNAVKHFIAKARDALAINGTLLIFERGPLEIENQGIPYSLIPFLLFFRSFRPPAVYRRYLENFGFRGVKIQKILLEMPFYLITAIKE